MNENSNCKIFTPFAVCTGNGICLVDGTCQCNQGWSSIGDFSTRIGDHCGINSIAITVLWIITLLPSPFLFYISAILLLRKIRKGDNNYNANQKRRTLASPSVSPESNKVLSLTDPAFIFPICFLMSSIFAFLLSALKISDASKYAIALHPVSTLFYFLFCSLGIGGSSIYLLVLVKFMLGYAKMMPSKAGNIIKYQSEIVRYIAIATVIISPLACFIPFFNIIFPNHDVECIIALSVAILFIVVYLGFFLLRYLHIISNEIKKHLESTKNDLVSGSSNYSKFISVKIKIDKSWVALFIALASTATLYSTIIFWPFLSKNSSYLFPILITSMQMVFVIFDKSVMNESKSETSQNSKQVTDTITSNAVIPLGGVVDVTRFTSPNSDEAVAISKQFSADDRYVSTSRVAAADDGDEPVTLQDA